MAIQMARCDEFHTLGERCAAVRDWSVRCCRQYVHTMLSRDRGKVGEQQVGDGTQRVDSGTLIVEAVKKFGGDERIRRVRLPDGEELAGEFSRSLRRGKLWPKCGCGRPGHEQNGSPRDSIIFIHKYSSRVEMAKYGTEMIEACYLTSK